MTGNMHKFKKVIIWGYPLYSHSHSFIHHGWYKAFKHLGYETYWFHDQDHPTDFDYENALFITEGYADEQMPVVSSSTYFVHVCKNPSKFVSAGARLIDIRFNVKRTRDYTYDYCLANLSLTGVDPFTAYEKNANDNALAERHRKGVAGYEAVYVMWATDMLPHEIDLNDAYIPRDREVHHIGSAWSANMKELQEFQQSLEKEGISFVVHDPWKKMTTNEEAKHLVQKSYIAPDIRGSGLTCSGSTAEECNHLSIGYIPCRTFKNISYGQLGITNSPAVKDLMQDHVIFSDNSGLLLSAAQPYLTDYDRIQSAMRYVQENHTYVNRVNALLNVL
jgi:hypothetical protein